MAETKIDEIGEIAVRVSPERPPSLFLEYWKNADETAGAFRGDWYLTGDNATRTPTAICGSSGAPTT